MKLGHPLTANQIDVLTEFSWLCVFQEVHELLQDYELKYCYVDRNKRTGESPFQALGLTFILYVL